MSEIKVGDKFRHFKGFTIEVIALAKHSETLEDMVVYNHDGNTWVRPLSMFIENDDVSNRPDNITGQKTRFEKIEGDN